ncbi:MULTISPECIES: type VII secretion-associated serine protease mycosin [Streptomyces]|uniref:type VII secretion-associated serine protease mycosin n=1 Tax=Streptomyces TaxID=1883 RepID=UPI00017E8C2B|nr:MULTISPECIES: type VII secretion-associated serine protease mycosin [Streptomyces]AKL65409.1 serine protease [Streptomyces sp. Mg1]EDX24860.1 serine protease [Streptomyces sp. Mg1]OKI41489.1 type VII secretion-associated serine protease [Streptomyces sp. CB03578]PJN17057.1 type VII secretion-associated serine protease [Streptomyces sp. CB02120-2]RPK37823.1 Subtilisin DY [Streptomyces sp. ADI91-18]
MNRPRPAGRTRHPAVALLLAALLLTAAAAPPAAAADTVDAIRDRQWGLLALRAEEAWGTTQGDGVTVAVLDTGVDDTHPDLAGQVLGGADLIGMGAGRGDRAWARHGTAMAGIIAGHGHGANRSQGVLGIAPQAKILPVRVILEEGDPGRAKARESKGGALAEGIRWAADHGADVISMSLGDDSESAHHEAAEDEAVQYALAKGVVVVASAGNSGKQGDPVSYPAAYPGVIAVAAVDRRGRKAAFSTRNWYATVSAPGVDVVIADPDRSYYEGWGTSAAAAFVSGSVALVKAAHPGLSPAQVKKLLEDTASDTPPGGRDDSRGHGMADPVAAIQAAEGLRPERPVPSPVAAGRPYFGPGPEPARAPGRGDRFAAVGAAAAGVALLALALVLARRPRRPGPG